MSWTEFSFKLQPSPIGGVGVFATHDIPAGTRLFNQNFNARTMKIKDIPPALIQYCIYINDEECRCPERFDRMEIGWYMNHSSTPNVTRKEVLDHEVMHGNKHALYTIKNIRAGEEIVMDYNSLNEPEHFKEAYYKQK